MKKMAIYEPAMCCSTGLCGVGVDTELLRISTVLNTLQKNGVIVDRFNLSNAPQEFVSNQVINEFINTEGVEKLPVAVLEGEIVITGRYPTNEEFIKFLNIPMSFLGVQLNFSGVHPKDSKATPEKSGGCGCSEGKCC